MSQGSAMHILFCPTQGSEGFCTSFPAHDGLGKVQRRFQPNHVHVELGYVPPSPLAWDKCCHLVRAATPHMAGGTFVAEVAIMGRRLQAIGPLGLYHVALMGNPSMISLH